MRQPITTPVGVFSSRAVIERELDRISKDYRDRAITPDHGLDFGLLRWIYDKNPHTHGDIECPLFFTFGVPGQPDTTDLFAYGADPRSNDGYIVGVWLIVGLALEPDELEQDAVYL